MFLSIDLSAVIPPVRTGLETCFQFTHAHTLLMGQPWGALVFKLGITLLTAVTEVKFQRINHNKTKGAVLHRWCSSYHYQLLMCAAPHLQRSSPMEAFLFQSCLASFHLLSLPFD